MISSWCSAFHEYVQFSFDFRWWSVNTCLLFQMMIITEAKCGLLEDTCQRLVRSSNFSKVTVLFGVPSSFFVAQWFKQFPVGTYRKWIHGCSVSFSASGEHFGVDCCNGREVAVGMVLNKEDWKWSRHFGLYFKQMGESRWWIYCMMPSWRF